MNNLFHKAFPFKSFLALLFIGLFITACGGGKSTPTEVEQDTTAPVITILGDSPTSIGQNETYTDAGATALDDIDGVVSVSSNGSVDTAKVGTYAITYAAEDQAGNKATKTRTVDVLASLSLANSTFMFSNSPTLNEETNITFDTEVSGDLSWSLVSEPEGSNLQISSSSKTLVITPLVAGTYKLKVNVRNASIETRFWVNQVFPYDSEKIEGNDGSKPLSEIMGAIKNQAWVKSYTLSEEKIRVILENYATLQVIGYESIYGALVTFDENSPEAFEELEKLSLESGIEFLDKQDKEQLDLRYVRLGRQLSNTKLQPLTKQVNEVEETVDGALEIQKIVKESSIILNALDSTEQKKYETQFQLRSETIISKLVNVRLKLLQELPDTKLGIAESDSWLDKFNKEFSKFPDEKSVKGALHEYSQIRSKRLLNAFAEFELGLKKMDESALDVSSSISLLLKQYLTNEKDFRNPISLEYLFAIESFQPNIQLN